MRPSHAYQLLWDAGDPKVIDASYKVKDAGGRSSCVLPGKQLWIALFLLHEFIDISENEDRQEENGQDIRQIKPCLMRKFNTGTAVGLLDEIVPSPAIAADTKQDID